jgi:hypothetical protein
MKTKNFRRAAILAVSLPVAAAAIIGSSLSAGAKGHTTSVSVVAAQAFTDTGIALTSGEVFSVKATGTVEYGGGSITGPAGFTFPEQRCGIDAYGPPPNFIAPGLNCWSLVAKIGNSGVIFPVGTHLKNFGSPVSGELFLGMNDNNYADNAGAWTATVKTP